MGRIGGRREKGRGRTGKKRAAWRVPVRKAAAGGGPVRAWDVRGRVTRWREAGRAEAARRRRRERSAARARERDIAAGRRPPLNGLLRAVIILAGFACMVVFAVLLAKVTLVPSPASVAMVHANVHPGSSIRAYFDQPDWKVTAKEVGGNVLLGVPFGLLLPVLFPAPAAWCASCWSPRSSCSAWRARRARWSRAAPSTSTT